MGSRDIPKEEGDEKPSESLLLSPKEAAAKKIEEIKREHGEDIEKAIIEVLERLNKQIEWALESQNDPERQGLIAGKKIDYGKLMEEINEAVLRMNGSMEECKKAVLLKIAKEVSEGNKIGRYQNFISSAVSSYFCGEQQGELGNFFSFYGELLKVEKRRKKVDTNEEKRKEQIEAAVAAEFDEFVQKDLNQKIDRLKKGVNISSGELATIRERFLDSKQDIIKVTTDILENRIKTNKKQFNLEDIRNKDANLVIWGELLRMAYGKYWTPDSKELVFGPTVNPVDGTEDMTGPIAIGLHTMAKPGFDNLNQLDLSKEEEKKLTKEEQAAERDNRIKELARKLIDQFTVHGLGRGDTFQFRSDLDGRTCLMLFEKAGFTVTKENVEYVEQGETTKKDSSWTVDTSGKHGFVVEGFGRLLFTDHHSKESKRDSSATSLLFDGLKEFGLFDNRISKEEMEALEQYVRFVTKEDNKEFSNEEAQNIFEYYTSNLAGLQRVLSEEQLFKIFVDHCKGGKEFDFYKPLNKDYLERRIDFGEWEGKPRKYKDVERFLRKSVIAAEKAINEIRKGGMVVHLGGQHGDVVIDTGYYNKDGKHVRKVGWGWDAVRAHKYGAYVVYDPENHYYQIFAKKELKCDQLQGANIRGHYILFSGSDKDPLSDTLKDILAALSGDPNYQIDPKLQKALDDDRKRQEKEREENITNQERKKKIEEISQILFTDRKKRNPGITEAVPSQKDLGVARELLKTKEEQESLEKIFSKEQYKTFLKLKEAFKRSIEELSENYSKKMSKQLERDLEKDLTDFITTEVIGNRKVFPAEKAADLKRLTQEGHHLDSIVSELKIKF